MKFTVLGVEFEIRSAAFSQTVLDPVQIAEYKRQMLSGETIPCVGGYHDRRTNTFYIADGHHRVMAAYEIMLETGDDSHLLWLLIRSKVVTPFEDPPAWLGDGKDFPTVPSEG